MAYNKADAVKVGEELADLVLGAMNGIQMQEELANAMEMITALAQGADDIQADTDAALLHIASGFTGKLGDSKVDTP
jgi:hypothetical protein